jgi:hypothetical protein
MQTVNLSVASVPLSFDVQSIRPEQILTWNIELQQSIVGGKSIPLSKYLRFEEAVYLPGLLDHIRTEAQRDQVEFGFAQLRLVLCFLRWANLKEKPPERFESPLILLPVRLTKKKGVRDAYLLEPLGSEAEVNPVLRYYFKQLYDLSLPESLDLATTSLDEFHHFLAGNIQKSEPAVSVNKIDRPRIHLIHATAKRRLDQYIQRTRLSGRSIRSFGDLDYSYDKENFHPLGLRLFQTKIRRPDTSLETIVQKSPAPRTYMTPPTESGAALTEQERALYTLGDSEDTNPYAWEYDLCSLTLGNFRYRKMSLVRDYAALLEDGATSAAFDAIFSLAPREVAPDGCQTLPLDDRYTVLTCDPTQATAIARARTGKSYIIQGPPGTGKSQTIANLIADYVARGRRVLFVCEKRAAIDVVYHRLRQNGLHRLCALIHDSQEDKKQWIMDLKETYESFLKDAGRENNLAETERRTLLEAIGREMKPLQTFDEAMRSPRLATVPLRQLLGRLIALANRQPVLSTIEKERVPLYGQWRRYGERIQRLATALQETYGSPVLANHPLRHLATRLANEERPLEKVTHHLSNAAELLDYLETEFLNAGFESQACANVEKASLLSRYAEQVRALAENGLLSLLQADSESSRTFTLLIKQHRNRVKNLQEARSATQGWKHKLPRPEAEAALAQAKDLQQGGFSCLKPAWWRLRGSLRRSYDFSRHRIKPTWTQVLETLLAEYEAQRAVEESEVDAQGTFHFEGPLEGFVTKVEQLRDAEAKLPGDVRDTWQRLAVEGKAAAAVLRLAALRPKVEQLTAEMAGFLDDCADRNFADLKEEIALIDESIDELPRFLGCLAEVAELPAEIVSVLRRLVLTPAELEAAMAERSWDAACRADRFLTQFTGPIRIRHARRLVTLYERLHAANSGVVYERVRNRFLGHVRISGSPHAQLSAEEKQFKVNYNRGRRELEHEFGKTMRYRSIRDLVTGDPGLVIQDLKPIWLMSPLSVSDTLPLDRSGFDAVIFDEASQVTLEAAVPCLFRAAQLIVVGDHMQLPPTNFFSAKYVEPDESLVIEDETSGERLEYDLDSNSFLAHAARVLPSTMLGWHYRSRSESLISFSNSAFYDGQLLTVPDRMLPSPNWTDIRVTAAADGTANADRVLDRAVSFHFLVEGVYLNRRNSAEADYIAFLVRELLARDTRHSVGIIAFSEAQQAEIHGALVRLGEEDPSFRNRLEEEFEREEDGQFVGLLVKNLENIQGDERNIIILSVCYGRGPDGKMLMNFGPINQSGGERRLNVAFFTSQAAHGRREFHRLLRNHQRL